MENFDLDLNLNSDKKTPKQTATGELNMQVSPVCKKDGQKVVYVSFSDKTRLAEGEIPKCRINSNKGFTDEEVSKLESYLKDNMSMLKETAAAIDPIRAFFSSE